VRQAEKRYAETDAFQDLAEAVYMTKVAASFVLLRSILDYLQKFLNGIMARRIHISPYQYQSRLSKGGQTFATIRVKAATANFVSPISIHVRLAIFLLAQLNKFMPIYQHQSLK